MQSGVGLVSSDVGETFAVLVAVGEGEGSVPGFGVGVEKETLNSAVGEAFGLEGGINSVGVTVGPQAANRHKNTQYEIQSMVRVLRILGIMVG